VLFLFEELSAFIISVSCRAFMALQERESEPFGQGISEVFVG